MHLLKKRYYLLPLLKQSRIDIETKWQSLLLVILRKLLYVNVWLLDCLGVKMCRVDVRFIFPIKERVICFLQPLEWQML